MTEEKLLYSRLKPVLSGVVDHGGRYLIEVETDLVQTNFLLREAIEKLSTGFMAIHASICHQQEIVEALLSGHSPMSDSAAGLRANFKEIDLHVNATVTGLQFQDMTSQLIDRALQQVIGLRVVLGILDAANAELSIDSGAAESVSALDKLNHLLVQQREKFDNGQAKTVCQTHMESGDIDLF